MINWRIINSRLGEGREQCSFIKSELFGGFAEVVFRSGLEAISTMPEINLVGVKSKNLPLGEAAFNLDSQQRLFDFAVPGAVR